VKGKSLERTGCYPIQMARKIAVMMMAVATLDTLFANSAVFTPEMQHMDSFAVEPDEGNWPS